MTNQQQEAPAPPRRVRPRPKMVTVTGVERLTPKSVRVTFGGPDLAGLGREPLFVEWMTQQGRNPAFMAELRAGLEARGAGPGTAVYFLCRTGGRSRVAAGDWWGRLLHPAEAALPAAAPVKRIDIQVAPRTTPVFGWNVPWWATFLILSIVVALLVRPFLGVQF